MATRFLMKILSNDNKILKISSNGNKILKSKLMVDPSYIINFNFSFPFSIEFAMKLSPLIVQALWDKQSPLLQLPHIEEDMLKHFHTKRRNIKSLQQVAKLNVSSTCLFPSFIIYSQCKNVTAVYLRNIKLFETLPH